MKKVEKKIKYQLISGDELIASGSSIQSLADAIECSWSYIYANKNKNVNNDGSWSFNFKGYNYTIITL